MKVPVDSKLKEKHPTYQLKLQSCSIFFCNYKKNGKKYSIFSVLQVFSRRNVEINGAKYDSLVKNIVFFFYSWYNHMNQQMKSIKLQAIIFI